MAIHWKCLKTLLYKTQPSAHNWNQSHISWVLKKQILMPENWSNSISLTMEWLLQSLQKPLPDTLKKISFRTICVSTSRSSSEKVGRGRWVMTGHSLKNAEGKRWRGKGADTLQEPVGGPTPLRRARLTSSHWLPKQGSIGTVKTSSMLFLSSHFVLNNCRLCGSSQRGCLHPCCKLAMVGLPQTRENRDSLCASSLQTTPDCDPACWGLANGYQAAVYLRKNI